MKKHSCEICHPELVLARVEAEAEVEAEEKEINQLCQTTEKILTEDLQKIFGPDTKVSVRVIKANEINDFQPFRIIKAEDIVNLNYDPLQFLTEETIKVFEQQLLNLEKELFKSIEVFENEKKLKKELKQSKDEESIYPLNTVNWDQVIGFPGPDLIKEMEDGYDLDQNYIIYNSTLADPNG